MTTAEHQGAPPRGFTELKEFFSSRSKLAEALGTKRDTLMTWEKGVSERLRYSSRERVAVLLALCKEAARRMPEREAVGEWMLTRQPALRGASPSQLVRSYGVDAFHTVRYLISAEAPRPGLQPEPSDEDLDAMNAELPPRAARRARNARKRLDEFLAAGGDAPHALL